MYIFGGYEQLVSCLKISSTHCVSVLGNVAWSELVLRNCRMAGVSQLQSLGTFIPKFTETVLRNCMFSHSYSSARL